VTARRHAANGSGYTAGKTAARYAATGITSTRNASARTAGRVAAASTTAPAARAFPLLVRHLADLALGVQPSRVARAAIADGMHHVARPSAAAGQAQNGRAVRHFVQLHQRQVLALQHAHDLAADEVLVQVLFQVDFRLHQQLAPFVNREADEHLLSVADDVVVGQHTL